MMNRVLVIDDQKLMRESLSETLVRAGYDVDSAVNGAEGIKRFESGTFATVITDLKMPEVSGMRVLSAIQKMSPETPVIVITGHGSVSTAVQAMKKGAYDYITKPFETDEIEVLVKKAVTHYELMIENESLKAQIDERGRISEMISLSRTLEERYPQLLKLAKSSATVLIYGESGVGKEIVAKTIHYLGSRGDKAFMCVNCAALSAGVLESELFGHEKGAFTGADSQRKGRFELADGGTILLDEISEIDVGLQAKLLRVLQERTFERVGSSVTRRVDVRVIATTNRNLKERVREGAFRKDLYYRLNVLPIEVPPLRERPEDIMPMTEYFLKKCAARDGRTPRTVTREALLLLEQYSYPGNVRELENLIERASVLSDSEALTVDELRPWLDGTGTRGAIDEICIGMPLEDVERILIIKTLERLDGHRVKTAEALGIGVRTLSMKIKKWGLQTRRNCRVIAEKSPEVISVK